MHIRNTYTLQISGGFSERFLNLCAQRGIGISNVHTTKNIVIFSIPARDLKALRAVLKITGFKMRILKREGPTFFIKKHKKRKLFAFGFLLFMCTLLLFSSFVWSISVVGHKNLTENEIKSLLSSCGFRPGVVKYTMNIHKIKEAVLLSEPRLSWLWITFSGTRATVEVRERSLPDPEDTTAVRDMVASHPGIITHISVLEGTPQVKVGDTVVSEQILIDRRTDAGRITRADGIVTARTWFSIAQSLPLDAPILSASDAFSFDHALLWHNRTIPLCLPRQEPTHAITEITFRRLHLFETLPLPIYLMRMQKTEAVVSGKNDLEHLLCQAETMLFSHLQTTLPPDAYVVSHSIKSELLSNHNLEVTLTAEALINIAVPSY
ncbi:MAG: sporulation protein YqfD [Clostridia bacterium]|nr:sporulation protein YqfD [Clostridia bacterium]